MEYRLHFNSRFYESKYGWKLTRETYIPNITDPVKKLYSKKELKEHLEKYYINFDLNMEYFKKLKKEEFDKSLNKFLKKYPEFQKLENLESTKNMSGYYIMVLGEYKQVYIGTGKDIYKRLRRHMSDNQDVDCLIWGSVTNSILSINSFRPFDTTEIYVYFTSKTFESENKYIEEFSDKFVLNRTCGGIQENGFLDVEENARFRNLLK